MLEVLDGNGMARQFILEKLGVLDCENLLEARDVGGVDAEDLCWLGPVCARAWHLEKRQKNRVQNAKTVFMRPVPNNTGSKR
jgi:hypothetical protein